MLFFIDFYQFWLDFGAPEEAKNHQNPKKNSKKARPKKGQKKIELTQAQMQGSAAIGGPIKLRFRADQHDFAGFFHAFFADQFLQENDAKSMQSYASELMLAMNTEMINTKEIE